MQISPAFAVKPPVRFGAQNHKTYILEFPAAQLEQLPASRSQKVAALQQQLAERIARLKKDLADDFTAGAIELKDQAWINQTLKITCTPEAKARLERLAYVHKIEAPRKVERDR